MARVMVFTTEVTCNLNANRIEIKDDYIKVYNNEKFVGIFDLSVCACGLCFGKLQKGAYNKC